MRCITSLFRLTILMMYYATEIEENNEWTFTFDQTCRMFFDLCYSTSFHWDDCALVLTSYSSTVSLLVYIFYALNFVAAHFIRTKFKEITLHDPNDIPTSSGTSLIAIRQLSSPSDAVVIFNVTVLFEIYVPLVGSCHP